MRYFDMNATDGFLEMLRLEMLRSVKCSGSERLRQVGRVSNDIGRGAERCVVITLAGSDMN